MFKLNHISVQLAERLKDFLKGECSPTENRVLICSPKDQDTMVGGIIVPGSTKEGMPREGVVIFAGPITEDYNTYKPLLKNPGMILTYGLYAGKEVDLWEDVKQAGIELSEDKWEFTVLALNEIIYVHENKNV